MVIPKETGSVEQGNREMGSVERATGKNRENGQRGKTEGMGKTGKTGEMEKIEEMGNAEKADDISRMKKSGETGRGIRRIRVGLMVILVAFLLAVWPGYLARSHYLSRTNSAQFLRTDELREADAVKQYFRPMHAYLNRIDFALEFDEQAVGDASLAFMLCGEDGKVLTACEIPMRELSSQCYYSVEVNKILSRDKLYYWVLTMPEYSVPGCRLMYTTAQGQQAPENQGFLINDEPYGAEGAQTVSQYQYFVHPDKAVILGNYWCGAVLVYFVALEAVNRLSNRLEKRQE